MSCCPAWGQCAAGDRHIHQHFELVIQTMVSLCRETQIGSIAIRSAQGISLGISSSLSLLISSSYLSIFSPTFVAVIDGSSRPANLRRYMMNNENSMSPRTPDISPSQYLIPGRMGSQAEREPSTQQCLRLSPSTWQGTARGHLRAKGHPFLKASRPNST